MAEVEISTGGRTQVVVLSAIAGLETSWLFSALNPSLFTIEHFEGERRTETVRAGYLIAAGMGLGFAAFISHLSKSYMPLAVSLIISLVMVVLYELALRGFF